MHKLSEDINNISPMPELDRFEYRPQAVADAIRLIELAIEGRKLDDTQIRNLALAAARDIMAPLVRVKMAVGSDLSE